MNPTNDQIQMAIARAKGWRLIRFVSTDTNPPTRTVSSLIEPGQVAVGESSEFWVTENIEEDDEWSKDVDLLPAWSTDIAAAWELVEEMAKPEHVTIDKSEQWVVDVDNFSRTLKGWGKTAPRAICLAWLKWKGIEVQP